MRRYGCVRMRRRLERPGHVLLLLPMHALLLVLLLLLTP